VLSGTLKTNGSPRSKPDYKILFRANSQLYSQRTATAASTLLKSNSVSFVASRLRCDSYLARGSLTSFQDVAMKDFAR
jgi:hypothetical protein